MIRKPDANWSRRHEGEAVRTVRTATAVAADSVRLARRVGQTAAILLLFSIGIFWSSVAIGCGLQNMIGLGMMAAFMFWLGFRALVKARAG